MCVPRVLVERASTDAECLADFGRAISIGDPCVNGGDLFRRQARTATLAATCPRSSKPSHCFFNDQAPLKFSQSREDMERQTPGRRAGFYAFRRAFKAHAGRFPLDHDLDQFGQ